MISTPRHRRLSILYEHPDWFTPLFEALERRAIPFDRLHADGQHHDPTAAPKADTVVLNRMSPSAWGRGRGSAIAYTSELLSRLEADGATVLNGSKAWQVEISKARQLALLAELGLPAPRARVVRDGPGAVAAAGHLRFPVVTKPNVGGSGAGIRRFETLRELEEAVRSGTFDLGPGGVGLVQEFIPARGGYITRVEVLGGTFLYAIRVYALDGHFELCPADLCLAAEAPDDPETTGSKHDPPRPSVRVESTTPPEEVLREVEAITRAAGIAVGGVEYVIDDRDGKRYYYDVNALSNFVADAHRLIGFDPFERLVDWLEPQLRR